MNGLKAGALRPYTIQMGKEIYLRYTPPFWPVCYFEEDPKKKSGPNFRAAFWKSDPSPKKNEWITSHHLWKALHRWNKHLDPASEEIFEAYLDERRNLNGCKKMSYTELDIPAKSLGMTPMDFQINGIWWLLLARRAVLADPVGMGKTLQFSAAWKAGYETKMFNRVLIATQKSTRNQITEEFERVSLIEPQVIDDTFNAEEAAQILLSPSHHLSPATIISQHKLRDAIGLIERGGSRIGEIFDVLVIDEAQIIKNRTAQIARSLRTISSPYVWLVTATPIENNLEEAHSLLQFVDPFLFGSWSFFDERYCIRDYFGSITGHKNTPEFKQKMEMVMIRRERKLAKKSMPTVIHYRVPLELEPQQRKLYNEFVKQTEEALDIYERKSGIERSEAALETLQLYTILRQICDHSSIIDPDTNESSKISWIEWYVQKKPRYKGLIYTQWTTMLELIKERLEQIADIDLFCIEGSMSTNKRDKEVKGILKSRSDTAIMLVTDAAKCGINLQSADWLVNVERHFNPAVGQQRGGRIDRLGGTGRKNVITLYTTETIEEKIEQKVRGKMDLHEQMLSLSPPLERIREMIGW